MEPPLSAGRARRGATAPRELHVRAYAKVNLGLEVLAARQDGYHELRTLFQTITLHDDLVYVMNADSNSIAGFRLDDKQGLKPI